MSLHKKSCVTEKRDKLFLYPYQIDAFQHKNRKKYHKHSFPCHLSFYFQSSTNYRTPIVKIAIVVQYKFRLKRKPLPNLKKKYTNFYQTI